MSVFGRWMIFWFGITYVRCMLPAIVSAEVVYCDAILVESEPVIPA